MLSFFDYLRRRAFESVLLGVQQAMDVVEHQRMFETRDLPAGSSEPTRDQSRQADQPTQAAHQPTDRTAMPSVKKNPAKLADSQDPSATATEDGLPEPRLRAAQRRGAKA